MLLSIYEILRFCMNLEIDHAPAPWQPILAFVAFSTGKKKCNEGLRKANTS